MKVISVIGKDGEIPENLRDAAYTVGSAIAEKGFVLACGGHTGVMEAACKGAKDRGGLTIGIMPEANGEKANPYVDVILPTAMGYARNTLVALAGEVVIAVGGSTGTL
ncbi:MAG: TIGR00725 family protein, partial [Methanobacteriota archaeon]